MTEFEAKSFYQNVICDSYLDFNSKKNSVPLCMVYISQHECVGKTHQIIKRGSNKLYHVPINSRNIDTHFVVQQLLRAPMDQRAYFHINVSSCAGLFSLVKCIYNICMN